MEMSLAKRLAHTLKSERDVAFLIVSDWICGAAAARGGREEMMKMWKALFYCVWMSDGPLVQGELSLRLAGLVRRARGRVALDFLGAFFETLRREWLGLDRHRVDKFLALTRRFVYEAFCLVSAGGWGNAEMKDGVIAELEKALLEPPNGLASHVADVFIDELASSGAADSTPHALAMLAPLFTLISRGVERTVVARAVKTAFEETLLPALEAAHAGLADEAMTSSASASASASAAPAPTPTPPAFRMRGLPPEARIEKHAMELKTLVDDRDARLAVRAVGFAGVSIAAIARAIFALAGDAVTLGQNRDFAYKVHKLFSAAALRVGDAKREEDTFSGGAAFTADVVKAVTAKAVVVQKQAKPSKKRKSESDDDDDVVDADIDARNAPRAKARRIDNGKVVSSSRGVVDMMSSADAGVKTKPKANANANDGGKKKAKDGGNKASDGGKSKPNEGIKPKGSAPQGKPKRG